MRKIISCLIILFLFSCSENKSDLELTLLTKHVVCISNGNNRAAKIDTSANVNAPINFKIDKLYDSLSTNIVNYKLVNKSNKKYFLTLNENSVVSIEDNGLPKQSGFNVLDRNSFSFNLYKNDKMLEGSLPPFNIPQSIKWDYSEANWDCLKHDDSVYVSNIYKGKMRGNKYYLGPNRDILEHSFVIYPGETKYFTSIINLPLRRNGKFLNWLTLISPDIPNEASITLIQNEEFTSNLLSNDQKKEIQENKYVIFNGIIHSNKIPVKMISIPKSSNRR